MIHDSPDPHGLPVLCHRQQTVGIDIGLRQPYRNMKGAAASRWNDGIDLQEPGLAGPQRAGMGQPGVRACLQKRLPRMLGTNRHSDWNRTSAMEPRALGVGVTTLAGRGRKATLQGLAPSQFPNKIRERLRFS